MRMKPTEAAWPGGGCASDRIRGQGGGSSCAEARPGHFDCKGCFIFQEFSRHLAGTGGIFELVPP